ncbi:MAG: hypothetical protein WDW38_002977 [Sanguina aurantia]
MDPEHARKVAVLGLPWETTEDTLRLYFCQFGLIEQVEVMKDRYTSKSRGFGFVTFMDAASANRALAVEHTIDGRRCEAKMALPKGDPTPPRTTRVFIARIPPSVTELQFRSYFEAFGKLQDAYMPRDHSKQGFRGIGFVTYASADSVEKVMAVKHWMNGHEVAIDRATPKDEPSALRTMFARLPMGDTQRRSFDNGAGIIGPGLTSVNMLASNLLMGGPSMESHFSNLRSLSEDRSQHNTDGSPCSSHRNSLDSNSSVDMSVQAAQAQVNAQAAQQHAAMVNAGFSVGFGNTSDRGVVSHSAQPDARRPPRPPSPTGMSVASQAMRASQALGLSPINMGGLGSMHSMNMNNLGMSGSSAMTSAAATTAALQSFASSRAQQNASTLPEQYANLLASSSLYHNAGSYNPELSVSILSNGACVPGSRACGLDAWEASGRDGTGGGRVQGGCGPHAHAVPRVPLCRRTHLSLAQPTDQTPRLPPCRVHVLRTRHTHTLAGPLHKASLNSSMANQTMLADANAAAAVQHLMAAAAHGRRSMDSAMPAAKRLENPAVATARRSGPRIFIGKLTKDTSEADVKEYFVKFGYVMDVYLPKAKDNKSEHRGFGFVTFETTAAIQRVVAHGAHRLKGSTIAIDIAMPKVEEDLLEGSSGDGIPGLSAAFSNLPSLMAQRI